uniref:phosphoribosylformylglycinamidine cyclo-ligase n=1 Tax=Fagus sylvatica TaxID=28930 RepID=A0A2N9G300_FAGSY
MPDFYANGEYDLSGFAVGIVKKDSVIDGRDIVAGDVLIGLPSSGVHSNGFSLVRRVVTRSGLSPKDKLLGEDVTLGEALMAPTVIYVKQVLEIISKGGIKGIAHITGGGFTDNIPRGGARDHRSAGLWWSLLLSGGSLGGHDRLLKSFQSLIITFVPTGAAVDYSISWSFRPLPHLLRHFAAAGVAADRFVIEFAVDRWIIRRGPLDGVEDLASFIFSDSWLVLPQTIFLGAFSMSDAPQAPRQERMEKWLFLRQPFSLFFLNPFEFFGAGNIEDAEMRRTFNMGIGMVLVVSKEASSRILESGNGDYKAYRIGEVVSDEGVTYH